MTADMTCFFRARQVAKYVITRMHGTTAAILKNLMCAGVASLAQNLHSQAHPTPV